MEKIIELETYKSMINLIRRRTPKFNGKITLIHVYSVSLFTITPTQTYKYVQAIRNIGAGILAEGKESLEKRKRGVTRHAPCPVSMVKQL